MKQFPKCVFNQGQLHLKADLIQELFKNLSRTHDNFSKTYRDAMIDLFILLGKVYHPNSTRLTTSQEMPILCIWDRLFVAPPPEVHTKKFVRN